MAIYRGPGGSGDAVNDSSSETRLAVEARDAALAAQAAAEVAQAAAEAAFDAFDDIYLGAKSSNPTVDNDGNALTTGDQYFNTVSNELRVWNGSSWQAASVIGGTVTSLTVTGNTTLGDASTDTVTVNANNITTPNGIAINGTTIPASKTLVVTTDIGSTVQAYDVDTAKLDAAQSWSAAQSFNAGVTLGDASGDALTINSSAVSIPNGLNFDSNTFVIDATNNRVGVGQSSPSTTLDVNGNAKVKNTLTFDRYGDSSDYLTISSNGNGIYNAVNLNHVWQITSSEKMRLDTSGNLGIGTSSPSGKLTVSGGTSLTSISDIVNGGSNANFILANPPIRLSIGYVNDNPSIQSYNNTNVTSDDLLLNPFGGNVGIGTSSPSGYSSSYKQLIIDGGANPSMLQLNNTTTGSGSNTGGMALIQSGVDGFIVNPQSTGTLRFYTNNTERLRLDSSGNLGLGVTPSASNLPTIQSGYGILTGNNQLNAMCNAYYNSGWLYTGTGYATQYQQLSGQHIWKTAASGTAGSAVSFTQAMTLDASGNLGVGTTSPGYKLDIYGASLPEMRIRDATVTFQAYTDSGISAAVLGTVGSHALVMRTNAVERMRIDSSGNVGIGNTPSGTYKLQVSGLISDTAGNVRSIPQNSQTAAYVLVAGDNGKHISITTGGVTVNASVFSVGDVVTIFNNSGSNQTITQGTSVTMRQAGTANTGNRTLAQYGVATILCVVGGATPTFVISGAGLT